MTKKSVSVIATVKANDITNNERKVGKTMNYNKMTKAQLIEMLEQKEKKNKEFNIWNYTYKTIVDGYIKSGEQKEFSFEVRRLQDSEFKNDKGEIVKLEGSGKVLTYLRKLGALKMVKFEESFTEEGKRQYTVTIKDLDINVEKEGKFGKYKMFANYYGALKLA